MRVYEAIDTGRLSMQNNAVRPAGKDTIVKNSEDYPDLHEANPEVKPEYKNDVLEKIICDLNKKLNVAGRELRCSVHKKTGQVMVKVVDTDSGKTVREIPPEKSLDILAKILEQSGLLVDKKT